jgi:outer membrane protein OmpA-like peptidoglycan-associated protein
MRFSFIYTLIFFSYLSVFHAQKISGNWIGMLTNFKQDSSEAIPVLLSHQVILNFSNGTLRIEDDGTVLQYEVSGAITNKKNFTLNSSKSPMLKPKGGISVPFSIQFSMNDSSGYVESIFNAPGSPYHGYHLYLERDIKSYELVATPILSTGISKAMLSNIKQGIPAKEKRFKELQQFEFNPVFFEYNRYELDSVYTPYLLRICRILKSHSDLRIKIIGNTDGDGTEAFNLQLSKQRANEIKLFLISHGILSDRMIETYNGELNPIDSNETEAGKKKNRRVDFKFI